MTTAGVASDPVVLFGLALTAGFAWYRRYRDAELQVEALERQSNAARLAALRMQLSPHTLFNLLNTIRGQIGWDPEAARQLVVQLSELLRKLLNAGEREFSLLADELQFVRLYLGLQHSRFPDRLHYSLPESVPALWMRHRARWEYGHATGFALQLIGLAALVTSVLVETPPAAPARQEREDLRAPRAA